MSLFEEKEKITRKEFRDVFRKRNPILPGTGRKLIGMEERKKMEEKLFGKKFVASTSKDQYEKLVGRMRVEKYKLRDVNQRQMIDKKVKFLKRLGGI